MAGDFVTRDPDLLDLLQFWGEPEDRDGKLSVWNTVKLGGKIFPGVDSLDSPAACIVMPHASVGYAIDRQKVKGKSGHRLVSEGYLPKPITLRVRIWRKEQWSAFLSYLPQINPKIAANKLRPFFIDHPYLQALGITQIVINEIPTPEESGNWGEHVFEIGGYEVLDPTTKDVTKTLKKQDAKGDDFGVGLGDERFDFKLDRGPR